MAVYTKSLTRPMESEREPAFELRMSVRKLTAILNGLRFQELRPIYNHHTGAWGVPARRIQQQDFLAVGADIVWIP